MISLRAFLFSCLALPAFAQTPLWKQGYDRGTVHAFAVSPDGTRMAVVGQERGVEVRETGSGRLLQVLGDSREDTLAVAWSPSALVVAHLRGGLAFHDPQTLALRSSEWIGVRTLAFAPDGRTLACGGHSGELGLWDASAGKLSRELQPRGSRTIVSLDFSPDGLLLAAGGPGAKGSEDGQVQLWELATGIVKTLIPLPRLPFSLAFAPDSGRLATGDWGGFVTFWDPRTGARIAEARGHSWWVRALAFTPDGRHLLSAGLEDLVVWDVAQAAPIRTLLAAGVSATSLGFSADGQTLYLGGWTKRRSALLALGTKALTDCRDPQAREWPLGGRTPAGAAFDAGGSRLWVRFPKTLEPLAWPEGRPLSAPALPADTHWLWDFALSPDGRALAIAGDPFRLATGAPDRKGLKLRPISSQVLEVAFGGASDRVVLRLNEGKLLRVSLAGGPDATLMEQGAHGTFALDPAGRWLALGAGLGVELRSPADGRLLHWLPIANGSNALAFDGSGSRLAVLDSPPRVWNLDTLEPYPLPEGEPDENGRWDAMALDREGRLLALARNPPGTDRSQGEIYLLDVPSGAWITRFLVPSALRTLAFHPEGRYLVAVPETGPMRSWDVGPVRDRLKPPAAAPRPVPALRFRAEDGIYSMVLTPDGTRAALGTMSGQIQIWNLASGVQTKRWSAAAPHIPQPMAFSPDGRLLALGASGLELWDREQGVQVRRLAAPSVRYQTLAFSPDGRSLVARGDSGFTRWSVSTGALEEEIGGFQPLGKHPVFHAVEGGLIPLGKAGWAHHQYGFLKILDPDFKVLAQAQGPSHSGYELPFAATADGRLLAVGSGSRIELWQVSPLLRLGLVGAHASHITALAFTPDGRLISAGFDGVLRVWENPENLVGRNPE